MMTTRWSSTDSATSATLHVSPSRCRVSPTSGTRSVITYSQAPEGKRMVRVSGATGRLSPPDLARCQVGTARGRALGRSRVAGLCASKRSPRAGRRRLVSGSALLAEVRAPEPARLRGGEPWRAQSVDDFVREVPLVGGKTRRCVPAQSRSNVVVDSLRLRAVQLVGAPMQVPDLLNQRLKWIVVHYRPHEATAGGLSFGRNLLGLGPPAAVRAPFHIRSARDDFRQPAGSDEPNAQQEGGTSPAPRGHREGPCP